MISSSEIKRIMINLKNNRHRSTTQRNYYSVWKIFNKFYLRLDKKPKTWEKRLTFFVTYLVHDRKQSSMIKSYISAIRAILQDDGYHLKENQYLLNSLTKACCLKNDVASIHLPISKGMLAILIRQVLITFNGRNQPYLALLYATLLNTSYFGLFRASELTWTPSKHAVLAKDVQIATNKKKILFILRTTKTLYAGSKPQLVKITNSEANSTAELGNPKIMQPLCPYEMLRTYASTRQPFCNDLEQFFVFSDGTPITASQLRACLKKALIAEKFEHTAYGLHSLQAGRTGDLLKLGLSVDMIKKMG